jgi:hypothetical protein
MRHALSASVLVLAALAAAPRPAAADGLFLRLDGPKGVASGQPVTVRLKAIATRPFHIVGTPEFLVDDGKQVRVVTEGEGRPALAVTPDRPAAAEWRLDLPEPGRYRIRARYRLADRVVDSNKISIEVKSERASAE